MNKKEIKELQNQFQGPDRRQDTDKPLQRRRPKTIENCLLRNSNRLRMRT